MDPQLEADCLRSVFLEESAALLPQVEWRPGDNQKDLLYPQVSPTLGGLGVSFECGEITLWFGHRGYHQHHTPEDGLGGDALAGEIRRVARVALEQVRALVTDEVVFRWGISVSGTIGRCAWQGAVARLWRRLTPWVKETVWSGTLQR